MMLAMATGDPIGTRIAKRRQMLGLTQSQLAALVGASKTSVAKWESGAHYPQRKLGALEHALGMNLTGGGDAVFHPDLADPAEALIWGMTRYREDERRDFILDLRARRRAAAGTG